MELHLLYLSTVALGLLGLFTILTNGFVIGFYQRKWREAVPLMYIMIAVCDSVTGVVALFHACIFSYCQTNTEMGQMVTEHKSDLFPAIYIILQSATRTSLFYNTVLAIVRTINITQPFHPINKPMMALSAIFYPVSMVVTLTVDLCLSDTIGKHTWNYFAFLFELPGKGILAYPDSCRGQLVLFLVIPLILPTIVCLICAVVQIYSILKPSVISPPSIRERKMTLTIVMLTLVCLTCNTPYTGFLFFDVDETVESEEFSYILHTLLPFVQAMLNPAILLMRGAALRTFVLSIVRRLFNRGQLRNTDELEMVVMNNATSG